MNHLGIMRRGSYLLAAVALMGVPVNRALADAAGDATRPGAPDSRPAVPAAGGNWWDAPVPAGDRRMPEREDPRPQSGYGHESPYASHVTDYPSAAMSDWVMANTMAARARMMRMRAESELGATIRRVQQRFDHSKDFSDAVQAERQAYADYTAARQKALGSVANDPKYHAITLLRDELGEKLAARRASKDASKDEVVAMATLKMQYASDARAIEVAVLENDDNLKSARNKMIEASRRVADLHARFDDSLHDNAEIMVARRNVEDARVAVVETATLASGASIASEYALNYSYYLHRNDNGGTFGPYGANGVYGAGYTSPYWGR